MGSWGVAGSDRHTQFRHSYDFGLGQDDTLRWIASSTKWQLPDFGPGDCRASRPALGQQRRNIGYIFQAHKLWSFLTAKQNVRIALELHGHFLEQDYRGQRRQ